jgi:chemotaxis signal transduction protein
VSALEALRASFVRDLHLPREIRSVRGDLHVVVEVSGSLFGISASSVLEIVKPHGIVPVPGAPRHCVGVLGHRQEVHGVVDLGSCLGLVLCDPKWVLLLRPSSRQCGVLVGELVGMEHIAVEREMEHERVAATLGGRSVSLLDLDQLLKVEGILIE